ncbi:replication initiation factor domain-containing protein [Xenorhabdus bovienii]|uniref:RstA phage-related replication protein n=1 Tax=Xenorhabdus bovienii str. kraussei Becker Underwood TaxID=1398204 RepID=A0A077PTG5_XENBV|nr:replication initiation factor domain-containing protein [Xenorhabdus bovienii]CDH24076.1 RstA phage-related replication protein [Xenorhabdus bovienii str. kraussei Becker Underwood]
MATDRTVFIDWLDFTAPLSCMKDVHTFQEKGHEWRKYEYLPSFRHYQHSRFSDTISDDYVFLPASHEVFSSAIEDLNRKAERYNRELLSCLHSRLKRFIAAVFGLFVGPARGIGGHFYEDSAILYSENGGNEKFGTLYWGGKHTNGTFYVQIGGKGCAHVFSGTTPEKIYRWFEHLDITSLRRLDLATDDYDCIFTPDAARAAYNDDAFYGGMGKRPKKSNWIEHEGDGSLSVDVFRVGSRKSRVYWRIYDKAVEQKVSGTWHRSEAELSEIPSEVLLDIQGTYTGLCAYAASINSAKPKKINRGDGRKAIDAIEAKVSWLRKQASSSIAKLIHFFEGDTQAVLSMIVRDDHISDLNLKLDLPPIYQTLINEKLGVSICPF